jgi:hypothetical protein
LVVVVVVMTQAVEALTAAQAVQAAAVKVILAAQLVQVHLVKAIVAVLDSYPFLVLVLHLVVVAAQEQLLLMQARETQQVLMVVSDLVRTHRGVQQLELVKIAVALTITQVVVQVVAMAQQIAVA